MSNLLEPRVVEDGSYKTWCKNSLKLMGRGNGTWLIIVFLAYLAACILFTSIKGFFAFSAGFICLSLISINFIMAEKYFNGRYLTLNEAIHEIIKELKNHSNYIIKYGSIKTIGFVAFFIIIPMIHTPSPDDIPIPQKPSFSEMTLFAKMNYFFISMFSLWFVGIFFKLSNFIDFNYNLITRYDLNYVKALELSVEAYSINFNKNFLPLMIIFLALGIVGLIIPVLIPFIDVFLAGIVYSAWKDIFFSEKEVQKQEVRAKSSKLVKIEQN